MIKSRNSIYMIRTYCALWFILLSMISYAQIKPTEDFQEKISTKEKNYGIAKLSNSTSQAGLQYDIKYERICLTLNPAIHFVQGNIAFYFLVKDSLNDTLSFDFHSKLIVDSIIYGGLKINYLHRNNLLLVFNVQYKNTIDSLIIYYNGSPLDDGLGAFTTSVHDNGTSVLWTLSEPYGANRWMPCKESLSDKIDSLDIFVKVPSQYKVASNGLLKSVINNNDGYAISHWQHRYPIATYLIGICVADFEISNFYAKLDNDSVLIENYFYPEQFNEAKELVKGVIPVIQLYSRLFTPYPFIKEKYGHAEFGWGGGMEHQTMSFMGDFSHELMAHELAHSWVGNMITCASWHDIWLNEGFATYFTGLTYEFMFDGQYWNLWKQYNIKNIISKPYGSVYVKDTTDINRIFDARLSYSKGAMVLHMLRWIIGDSAFFGAIRNYLRDTTITYKFATTKDVIRHFEIEVHRDLSDFFNRWVYGEGYPKYNITWIKKNNNRNLWLSVKQVPSLSSVSLFDLPVEIEIKGEENFDTTIVINPFKSYQEYDFLLNHKVTELIFDPHHWLIAECEVKKIENSDILIFQNIVKDKLNIRFNLPSNIDYIKGFYIYNITGELVYKNSNVYTYSQEVELPIDFLPDGMYFIKIYYNEKPKNFKFVKI